MPTTYTTCPRCRSRAKANARGPNVIWCKKCGGFVDVDPRDDGAGSALSDDPERAAMSREAGIENQGRKLSGSVRKLKGGLEP